MKEGIQQSLVRFAAFAALLIGAAVAIALAAVTLVAGLVIGVIAAGAAWFGLRGSRGLMRPAARARGDRPREVTVIDVEMREIEPGERAAGRGPRDARRARF